MVQKDILSKWTKISIKLLTCCSKLSIETNLQNAPLRPQRLLTNRTRFRIFAATVSSVLRVPEVFQVQQLTVSSPEVVDGDRLLRNLEKKLKSIKLRSKYCNRGTIYILIICTNNKIKGYPTVGTSKGLGSGQII